MRASDLAGTADLATVNGTVEANYTSLNNVHEIKLKSVNGSVDLLLPQSPNAEVEASTVNGSLSTDFPLTVKGHWVGKNMSGTLGSGGVHIELEQCEWQHPRRAGTREFVAAVFSPRKHGKHGVFGIQQWMGIRFCASDFEVFRHD